MPTLINTSTNQPEEIPQHEVGQAFFSGTHAFPGDAVIPMLDPDGKVTGVYANEIEPAVTQGGYSFPSQAQVDDAALQHKYGEGLSNEAKAALGGAARTATFGLSDAVLPALGVTTKEALRERAARNPISNFLGEAGGILAPLVATGGASAAADSGLGAAAEMSAPSLISKAGQAVEGAVTPALSGDVTSSVARKILARTAGITTGSAVEGAAYGLGQSVSEAALGDPDLTAQKVAANIGYSALIGGGIGGLLGLSGAALGAFKKPAVAEVVDGIKNDTADMLGETGSAEAASSAPGVPAAENSLAADLEASGTPEERRAGILSELKREKSNAGDIRTAGDAIGAPVTEGMVSASKKVQDLDSFVTNQPTIPGVQRQALYEKGFAAAENATQDAMATTSDLSEAETGNLVKKGLIEAFQAESQPIDQLYSQIKKDFGSIPLNDRAKGNISRNILKLDGITNAEGAPLSASSPEYQLAKAASDELENLKTVEDLKNYQTILRRRTAGNPELRYVAGAIQEKLRNLEENEIVRFAKSMMVPENEASSAVADLLQRREAANAKYSALRSKMSEIGDVIGKRKIYGPKDFLDHLEDLPPETLTRRLFAKNNSEFLEFFSKEFPDQFRPLADFQKNQIFSKTMVDGRINPLKVVKAVDALSPEVKRLLFSPEELEKLSAVRTWVEAVPKNINPSGTGKAEAYARFFTNPIAAATQNARDRAITAGMGRLVGGANPEQVRALAGLERMAQKTSSAISRGAKAVFKGGPPAIRELSGGGEGDQEDAKAARLRKFQKRSEDIMLQVQNPDRLQNSLEAATESLFPHAPKVAAGLQSSAISAASFLASKVPTPPGRKPLSDEFEPSAADISRFNRYYNAVEDPTSVLDQIADGSLTPEAVDSVRTVFPALYQNMVEELVSQMTAKKNKVPYRTRLMLSLFLGQDMDESTDSQAILANQATLQGPSKQADNQTVKTTAKGLASLSASDQALTPFQKTTQRPA